MREHRRVQKVMNLLSLWTAPKASHVKASHLPFLCFPCFVVCLFCMSEVSAFSTFLSCSLSHAIGATSYKEVSGPPESDGLGHSRQKKPRELEASRLTAFECFQVMIQILSETTRRQ